jgi:hypothetical protein
VSLIMPHIGYGDIVYGTDAESQRRLKMAFRAHLRYILSLRRLDLVSHLEISVMSASLTDYARIQLLQSVACPASVIFVFAISFCFVRAYEEFGSPGSSLSCNESVNFRGFFNFIKNACRFTSTNTKADSPKLNSQLIIKIQEVMLIL